MTSFRKRPVEVDAEQWLGDIEGMKTFLSGATFWFGPEVGVSLSRANWTINIVTLEGTMVCNIGDWVIKGIKNEFYPCKNDIFTLTYEEVM